MKCIIHIILILFFAVIIVHTNSLFAQYSNESGSTTFSLMPWAGYSLDEDFSDGYEFGFGIRMGVTVLGGFYAGVSASHHLNDDFDLDRGPSLIGGDFGFNGLMGNVQIHPYASFGYSRIYYSDYFYLAPAIMVGIRPAKEFSIGPEFRYLIVPAETSLNSFVISGVIGIHLSQ